MISPEISTAEAKQDKLFYVVASIIIINKVEQTCLLLKRSESEKVLPGKWSLPGGKLEHGEVAKLLSELGRDPIEGVENIFGKLAKRESKEECGLTVAENSIIIADKVFVRPDKIPVLMTTLATEYAGGSVVLEDEAFSDFAWVSREKLKDYDCTDSVRQEVELAFSRQLSGK